VCPNERHQQLDARVAESNGAAAADASPPVCSTQDPVQDDASGASSAASHRPPGDLAPGGREVGSDVQRLSRTAVKSRYVPRGVLREVYARDAGQCTYVSSDGRRCSARGFLEVHHHEAFALGGEATVENLRLACRAHNFWLAERELGADFMQGKLLQAPSPGCLPVRRRE
jgi:hypothetical protein